MLAISNNEIFYSYREYSTHIHHIVKANFIGSGGSSYSLNEVYHQTIPGDSTFGASSCLGENNETLWFAVNMGYVIYFQYNSTNFSLIGSK